MRAIRCSLILVIIAIAGCAVRQPVPVAVTNQVPPPVDVAALIRQGCYQCLEQALAVAQGDQRFEVAALLTVRAKELGLPYSSYRTTAQSALPVDPVFATYLEIIDALPVDPLTGDLYLERDPVAASATRMSRNSPGAPARLPRVSERVPAWRAALDSGAGSTLFRRYLDLAMSCSLAPRTDRESLPEPVTEDVEIPLLRYRRSLCGRGGDQLAALRAADALFVDADYTLARYALAGQPADLDEALRWIESARAAFPQSLAIATVVGEIRDTREEWADALVAYDEVLAQMPQHRDALLGRTVALSHLVRHDEAIASATRLIELGSWFIGDAHYWRAWNEFALQQYAAARVDTDQAKSRMVNAAVFTLSGLVEWNERRLSTAETEFEEALKMDFGRCDAARFLGRVRVQRLKVPEALAAFQQAIQCYDLSVTARQKLIADIRSGPGTEATRARLVAGHQRAIDAALGDRRECAEHVAALERRAPL